MIIIRRLTEDEYWTKVIGPDHRLISEDEKSKMIEDAGGRSALLAAKARLLPDEPPPF